MDTESTGKGFGLDKKKLFFSFGSAAVGIAAAALFESERERRSLIVRHYALRSAKIKRARRIVYLSDFHERRLGEIEERLTAERFGRLIVPHPSVAEIVRETLLS